MIQDKLVELNNDICEAVNCSAKATTTIMVKAGNQSVALHLCNGCISKFEDSAEPHSTGLQDWSQVQDSPNTINRVKLPNPQPILPFNVNLEHGKRKCQTYYNKTKERR